MDQAYHYPPPPTTPVLDMKRKPIPMISSFESLWSLFLQSMFEIVGG